MSDVPSMRDKAIVALPPVALQPAVLCSLLERRYLTDFDHAQWILEPLGHDTARPLLHEVTELGVAKSGSQGARAMQHVLTACHEAGHAVVSVLHGERERCRLYLGARRTGDAGARSTEDYLQSQVGALKAHFAGMKVAASRRMDSAETPGLARFIGGAPALGVVTGVPANRIAALGDPQNVEGLIRAASGYRYALMVVAEAVSPATIDLYIDRFRQMKSAVHGLVRQTRSESRSETSGTSRTEAGDRKGVDISLGAMGLGIIAQLASVSVPGAGALPGLAGALQTFALMTRMYKPDERQQRSESATRADGMTFEAFDEEARACEALIDRNLERLQQARSSGLWQSSVYVAGESEAALYAVFGALKSIYGGDASASDPFRTMRLPAAELRPAMQSGRLIGMRPRQDAVVSSGGPGEAEFDVLGVCVNSSELAILTCPPLAEAPGLPLRRRPDFALNAPRADDATLSLGMLLDHMDSPIAEIGLSRQAVNGHVFVSGTTGAGKSNTCKRLLLDAYRRWHVPFLVIEPAKAEYRHLAAQEELRGKLRIYAIGDDSPLPLRLNPFALMTGVSLLRHVDRLKAIFNAMFPMFAGMSYVLEDAILEVYEERGWNIHTSHNPFLPHRATSYERAALTPNLEDLRDKIDAVLSRRKYGQEVQQNMGAALRARLNSLLVGSKGTILNSRRYTPAEDIFGQPTVIELQNLGDDDEKAFVMALILVMLCEHAEARDQSATDDGLRHLTLIEEAHRLLAAPRGMAGLESSDPRGKAVSMFTDMLAEMRAYGEGFVIADQIPTKLAPEVLKNSNVKIIHRLLTPDDRLAVGQSVNLTPAQTERLGVLPRGVAVLHGEDIRDATLVAVPRMVEPLSVGARPQGAAITRRERRQLQRYTACELCESPCRFYPALPDPRADHDGLQPVLDRVLLRDIEGAWQAWDAWRHAQERRLDRALGTNAKDEATARGVSLCATIHAGQTWLRSVMEARNRLAGDVPELTPAQRLSTDLAARCIASLIADWLTRPALDAAATAAFTEAQTAIGKAFADAPATDAPECARCPAPCRVAGFAAGVIEQLRAPALRALADAEASVLSKHAQIERTLQQVRHTGPAFEGARVQAVLYCAVAQIASRQPALGDVSAVLVELAERAKPAHLAT